MAGIEDVGFVEVSRPLASNDSRIGISVLTLVAGASVPFMTTNGEEGTNGRKIVIC